MIDQAPKLELGSEETHELFGVSSAELKAFCDDVVLALIERDMKESPRDPAFCLQPVIERWWPKWESSLEVWQRHALIGFAIARCFSIAGRMAQAAIGGSGGGIEQLLESMSQGSSSRFSFPKVAKDERKH